MGKPLLALLFSAFGLAATAATGARAATLYGSDYVQVGVPDLAQAVAFFRDVLDCRLIGPADNGKRQASALLACDADSVVELFDDGGQATISPRQPLRFVTGDVDHAGEWLRSAGAATVEPPHRLASGPLAGRTAVDFMSPWGLSLQLLGRGLPPAPDSAIATADGD